MPLGSWCGANLRAFGAADSDPVPMLGDRADQNCECESFLHDSSVWS